MDGTSTSFSERIGDGVTFSGGGKLLFGAVQAKSSNRLEGEVSYVNLWDKVLSEASIQSIAQSCQAETGNLLQWSFFAAMAVGTVQYVPSSPCTSKGIVVDSALGWFSIAHTAPPPLPRPRYSHSTRQYSEPTLLVSLYAYELKYTFCYITQCGYWNRHRSRPEYRLLDRNQTRALWCPPQTPSPPPILKKKKDGENSAK